MVCIQVYGDVLKDGHQVKGDGLQKFIKEEKETNTGLIDKKIENNLNDLGVFDSEIEQFDDETLSLLNCGYDYHVDVVYYDETDDGLKKCQIMRWKIILMLFMRMGDKMNCMMEKFWKK